MDESTRVKADLIPYSDEYARDVRSWMESEETYQAVCRGKEFPPPDDIVQSWQRQGVTSYILLSDRKPVAYGELWARPLELAVEICHLLVSPYQRDKGYGVKTLQLLYDRAAARKDVAKVLINLWDDNEAALGCYLKAGFDLLGTSKFTTGLRLVRMIQP
ncbi:MAG: GNAT family N-acetyltransferase [bacterium]